MHFSCRSVNNYLVLHSMGRVYESLMLSGCGLALKVITASTVKDSSGIAIGI